MTAKEHVERIKRQNREDCCNRALGPDLFPQETQRSAMIEIEICPNEPRTSAYMPDGTDDIAQHMADCRASGDCEEACRYIRDHVGVSWRIIARNEAGEYENREATDEEKTATAKAIYFDSERDFTDIEWAEIYLIWSAAHDLASD